MFTKNGLIRRKALPEAYPLSRHTASSILRTSADKLLNGRTNSQLTAAEVLGFCWLCLIASRLRHPICLKKLYKIKPAALKKSIDNFLTTTNNVDLPAIMIPTMYGERPVSISRTVYNLLHALSNVPSSKPRNTILQRPMKSLYRGLYNILDILNIDTTFDKITFVTFLSLPCECEKDRC